MATRFLRTLENPAAMLAIVAVMLMSTGIVILYSASGARAGLENIRVSARAGTAPAPAEFRPHHGTDYLQKQLMWVMFGLAAGAFALRTPMDRIERWAPWILGGSLVLLVLVIASPLGVEAKGAKRWLRVGPFTIQPSEFAKIAMVLFMAKFLSEKREKIRDLKEGFLPALGFTGVFCVLILLEKDLGTIILMGTVILGMWALAQVKMTHLATIVVAAMPALVYLVFQQSYRVHRILAFLNPEKYQMTHGYQLNQSLIAVGSGGIFGTGLGTGLQKYHFLSESHTDFIFAIVGEELGLVGSLAVVVLFMAFVVTGLRISYRANEYFSGLAAAGLTMVIGWAAFINFFVVLGMAPTKGLALPFFSYGGSSMIASIIGVAILINISNETVARAGVRELA